MQTDKGNLPIKTATMAKIFAQQGHFDEAVEIYRHLLKQNPDRLDLKEALARTEEKRRLESVPDSGDIVSVLSDFIRLLLQYRQLIELQTLQRRAVVKSGSE
jgi:tetratricopeptide (TPR) repeat protein